MSDVAQPKQKFVSHKTLKEGWTYISIPDDHVVIGVKIAVTKVMKLFDPSGKPLKDQTGNPAYYFQSGNVVQVLTEEEYKEVIRQNLGE